METLINSNAPQVDVPLHAWTTPQKILFRFFYIYFPLYIIVNNNGALPGFEYLTKFTVTPFLHSVIPWIGKYILHLPDEITVFTNGSGDTTYDYVSVLALFVVSLTGCVVWSVIDRHRSGYISAYYWLLVAVRYYLALSMFQYGFAKVFYLQFPFPSLTRLLQPFGESSPMGLAWTFMGYSKAYNYFTGSAEVLGGLLLLFRRTAALGSILTLIVMTNVAMMNYCFDIPVKLLSTHMIVMCLFILAPDFQRFYDFFIRHRNTVIPLPQAPVFTKKALNYTLITVKYVLILGVLATILMYASEAQGTYGENTPKSPLYGVYESELYVENGDTVPPLLTRLRRWRRLIVDKYDAARVSTMVDSLTTYKIETDTAHQQFTLVSYADSTQKYTFVYNIPKKDKLTIRGKWQSDSIRVDFQKRDMQKMKLVNRSFHWINEYPYNR